MNLELYSDGGSRGNPGPAAAAFLIYAENGELLRKESRYLGRRTNNQAEYEALLAGLEAAAKLGAQEVVCHLDSELVCKQLNREYQVKNQDLLKLWKKAQDLIQCFKKIRFVNVPRSNSQIQDADYLLNLQLDKH